MASGDISTKSLTSTSVEENVINTTDVTIIPYIRESDIDFVGYNLRPTVQSWFYFDDKEMNNFITRANVLKLSGKKAFGDIIFNNPRETVSFLGGKAKVLLTETDQNTGNTVLYISPITHPKSNHFPTNTVVGGLTGLSNVVSDYTHCSGLIRASSNATQIFMGLDAKKTDSWYVGNVIAINTGTLCGQSSNIASYNGANRMATVSPAFTAGPAVNDVYSIGDYRKPYVSNTKQSIYTTAQGFMPGILHLPDPSANTQYAFRTGDRIFRILDNPLNQLVTTQGDKAYTSRADYRYTAQGLKVENTQITNRVTTTTQVNITTEVYDPIAQSFYVDGNVYKEGFFIPSIDLYFKNKGENLPVMLQVRPMVNGYPDSTTVIPQAEAVLMPDDVITTDLPNAENSLTSTTFTFPSPVYVAPDTEYAFVILTNDYGYDLWVSEVGQSQIGTGRLISQQPYLGTMFKSQSGRTFTALQDEDVMFKINKCVFDTSGLVMFTERKDANSRYIFMEDANSIYYKQNTAYDFFHVQSHIAELPGTKIDYTYRATVNATSVRDTTYTAFRPNKNTLIDNQKVLFGSRVDTPSYNVQLTLSTDNTDVSPVVFHNRQNLLVIQNKINNMEISNSIIAITNGGSGYKNGNTITFSSSSTGLTATGYVNVNATGAIVGTIITSAGGGYFENVTATVDSTLGTNGALVVSAETDSSGGPALARYISKTLELRDGFDSGDLRLVFDAVKPPGSNIQAYYKVHNALDPEPIDEKRWVKMVQKGNEYDYSTDNQPIEYEFRTSLTANNISYTSANATYTTFNQFKIKLVLASSSTLYQDVPFLYDVQVVAMPADVY